MVREPTKTDRGRDMPSIRQVSVFTENRVGALASLLGTFDSTKVRILALAVIQGFDCAIVRFVFNDTDAAAKELAEANYRFTICDLVAVEMPGIKDGLQRISKALLSAEIDKHYGEQDITVVSIINGALLFTADLLRQLSCPVRLDCIRVSSYRNATRPVTDPEVLGALTIDLENRHVLLIDDILDTGKTLSMVVKLIQKMNPSSLKTCVLLDKRGRREVPFDFGKCTMHVSCPLSEPGEPRTGNGECALVSIDADDPGTWDVEDGFGMAAGAEGRVDIDAAAAGRERGEHLAAEHADMGFIAQARRSWGMHGDDVDDVHRRNCSAIAVLKPWSSGSLIC